MLRTLSSLNVAKRQVTSQEGLTSDETKTTEALIIFLFWKMMTSLENQELDRVFEIQNACHKSTKRAQ